jgi:hypothetical protein
VEEKIGQNGLKKAKFGIFGKARPVAMRQWYLKIPIAALPPLEIWV